MSESQTNGTDGYTEARKRLVRSLAGEIKDERVLAAFERVPRERFVPPEHAAHAYEDRPLPIGHGQTISQPRMVALMLRELATTAADRVLEVGTGSGYQTALLAELAKEVVSVEIVPSLASNAARLLEQSGYTNVTVHLASEALGWPEAAPYDAIIVAAAAPRVPISLVDQLAPGGRLVLPVGGRGEQDLIVLKNGPLGITIMRKGACRFVPLLGREGFATADRDS